MERQIMYSISQNIDSLIRDKEFLQNKHQDYQLMIERWNFYLRSYLGGEEYRSGSFFT